MYANTLLTMQLTKKVQIINLTLTLKNQTLAIKDH